MKKEENILDLIDYRKFKEALLAIEQGADIGVIDEDGKTPLHYIARFSYFGLDDSTDEEEHAYDLTRALLTRGANPNARDTYENTPLHLEPDIPIAALLIEHKARVDARNKNGLTPFQICYESLIEPFYDPLRVAIERGYHDTLKQYLDQGPARGYHEFELALIEPIEWNWDEKFGKRPKTLELLLTHPHPGAVEESTTIVDAKKACFGLLGVLKKWHKTGRLAVPRDMRKLLCQTIFPSAHMFITLVPTKRLMHFQTLYGKHCLLQAAVTRHVAALHSILDCNAYLLQKEEAQILLNPAHIETILKPLTEESYRRYFFEQEKLGKDNSQ